MEEEMTKCNEVMTSNPTCCLPTDTVNQVAQMMKNEDVGSIPIVENQQTKKLMGIVTDRDLALKVVAEGRDPKSTRVEQVMTHDPVACHADDDLQQVLTAMAGYQLRRIPVIDATNRIVGIVAQADVAIHAENAKQTAKVVEEISKPAHAHTS
jgi:CBS domain-containing protein